MYNFIFTTDEATANNLKSNGFICIEENGNSWKFINDSKLNFSENKNIVFTNKLNI